MAISELTKRVGVAAVGIPLALGVGFVGGWALAAVLALIGVLGALEFFKLSAHKGAKPFSVVGAVLSASFVGLLAYCGGEPGLDKFGILILIATLVVATLAIWTRGVEEQPLLSTATTLAGAIYTGGLLSFGYLLRHLPGVVSSAHGAAILFAPVLLTWTSDTFAYFVGRRWGTRKLIPRVSPGKTVQGAVGAVVGSVIVAMLYGMLTDDFPAYTLSLPLAALFGAVMSVAAQVGDLAESLLKRDAGVKDSGNLLPGHGGALDRFDSLFFTLPVAYFFIRYLASGQ